MKTHQTVPEYYADRGINDAAPSLFNVFESAGYCNAPMYYNRRDFYKISLLQGTSRLSWHHHDIEIDRPALVIFNPVTPFAWTPVSKKQPGYFCLFRDEFLKESNRNGGSLQNSPLFKTGGNPVFFLDDAQVKYISDIFSRMLVEIRSEYAYKYDLLRNHLGLIIHEAMKMAPAFTRKQQNASERITSLFLELLERQFPIDSPDRSLQLKTAGDFAEVLAVHVNHLNHAVREVTGKPTSAHIADRILAEAKALLKHTDWPVSEIAMSLGFEYPNSFHAFFKKKTGHSPKLARANIL